MAMASSTFETNMLVLTGSMSKNSLLEFRYIRKYLGKERFLTKTISTVFKMVQKPYRPILMMLIAFLEVSKKCCKLKLQLYISSCSL